ncbi:hypothetical protein L7F22_033731 [Adiantum nelumboides]|nr:hypothetical protein [Adiantum nelumboides]
MYLFALAANVQSPPRLDIHSFECNELEHYCNRFPRLSCRAVVAIETGLRRLGGGNGGCGRGRGRAARVFGRGQGRNAHVYAALRNPTLEEEHERATVYAAIDNSRAQRQFVVIQNLATHQAREFAKLIFVDFPISLLVDELPIPQDEGFFVILSLVEHFGKVRKYATRANLHVHHTWIVVCDEGYRHPLTRESVCDLTLDCSIKEIILHTVIEMLEKKFSLDCFWLCEALL